MSNTLFQFDKSILKDSAPHNISLTLLTFDTFQLEISLLNDFALKT